MPKLDKIKTNIANFLEQKKQKKLSKLESSSLSLIFINWLFTNWITILLVLVLGGYGVYNYYINDALHDALLKEELEQLELDLEKMKKERELLLSKIKELEKLKKSSKEENIKVREEANKLNSEQKKKLLLQYKNRLLDKRDHVK